MSATTSIEWTDRTWGPVRGCSRVSEGCRHCYAERQAFRFSGPGRPYEGLVHKVNGHPTWTGQVRLVEKDLLLPLRWRKPQRIFVNSMSDLFHEALPDEAIDRIFAVMALAQHHAFQVLTKRPDRMRAYLADRARPAHVDDAMLRVMAGQDYPGNYSRPCLVQKHLPGGLEGWPLPNVWLGVSVEDQATADARIPLLLQTPAAVRFVSAEPLLGPVDLEGVPLPAPGAEWYGLRGVAQPLTEKDTEPDDWKYWTRRESKLDWLIVGGESGPDARPCAEEWLEDIVRQCQAAEVPVFVKQLGAYVVSEARAAETPEEMRNILGPDAKWPDHRWLWRAGLRDRKGGDPAEWPEHLRVRQFPEGSR